MTAGIVKTGFLSTYAATEIVLSTATITITQGAHTVAAQTGSTGTIQNAPLEAATQGDMGAYLPFVILRAKTGHTIYIQPMGTLVSEPIYTQDGRIGTITDTRGILLMRNPPGSGAGWLSTSIALPSGDLVDTTSSQNLSNKELLAGTLRGPHITGTFHQDGISSGFSGADRIFGQVGSQVVGAVTGTAVSISLAEERTMKIKASVLVAASDHSASVVADVTGLFRRAFGGNILMVGTTTPVTIGTTAVSVGFGIDTAAQAANILFTGIAGTHNFVADYEYTRLAFNT